MANIERLPGLIKIGKASPAKLLADTDTDVYTPTSGRIFYLEGLVATTVSGYSALVEIYDSPSANNVQPVAPIRVGTGSTVSIGVDVFKGVPGFKSGVVAKADTSGVAYLQVIGYEE